MSKFDVEEAIRRNPSVDRAELEKSREELKRRRAAGGGGAGYRLALPYSRIARAPDSKIEPVLKKHVDDLSDLQS